jgi:hypothetical protein
MLKPSKDSEFEKSSIAADIGAAEPLEIDDDSDSEDSIRESKRLVTAESLGLILKKVNIRYCEYKISNQPNKMLAGECVALSTKGMSFVSAVNYPRGTLMRVWVEIPNFWNLKSKLVDYGHTDAPEYFQMLVRSVQVEEKGKRTISYTILAETVNLDPADEKLLSEFLFVVPNKNRKIGSTKKSTL